MNAGFEDCTLLSQILDKHDDDFKAALMEFSDTRWENAHTICDLAMYNYIEVQTIVNKIKTLLHWYVISDARFSYKTFISNKKICWWLFILDDAE